MRLALFDLDNTLLAGDSDHSWGEWLCQRGLVDAAEYQARNDAFYADYVAGTLDVFAYQAFTQAILGRTDLAQLAAWHRQFMEEVIEPIILAKGEALLAEHRAAGDRLVIITATNRFVTAPIAERLGVETLIATECEMRDGRYTGQTCGVPCFQGGKVARLQRWLEETGLDTGRRVLLQRLAERPAAAGEGQPAGGRRPGSDTLRATAIERGWPVISLRG